VGWPGAAPFGLCARAGRGVCVDSAVGWPWGVGCGGCVVARAGDRRCHRCRGGLGLVGGRGVVWGVRVGGVCGVVVVGDWVFDAVGAVVFGGGVCLVDPVVCLVGYRLVAAAVTGGGVVGDACAASVVLGYVCGRGRVRRGRFVGLMMRSGIDRCVRRVVMGCGWCCLGCVLGWRVVGGWGVAGLGVGVRGWPGNRRHRLVRNGGVGCVCWRCVDVRPGIGGSDGALRWRGRRAVPAPRWVSRTSDRRT